MSDRTAGAPSPDELVRVVALDGPAGSGKSSVSRAVAKELGWRFVDTGATYRAVTLAALRAGLDLDALGRDPLDHDVMERLGELVRRVRVELGFDPDRPLVRLDGEDVTREIRSPEVTGAVSAVSAVPAVREALIALQRALMGLEGAVVEGRDIATVVAPRAAVKVYLDARPEVRAARRAGEQVGGGPMARDDVKTVLDPSVLHEQVRRALLARDEHDSKTNRLAPSQGAVHLETSDLTFAEVVAEVIALVRDAGLLEPAVEHDLVTAREAGA